MLMQPKILTTKRRAPIFVDHIGTSARLFLVQVDHTFCQFGVCGPPATARLRGGLLFESPLEACGATGSIPWTLGIERMVNQCTRQQMPRRRRRG